MSTYDLKKKNLDIFLVLIDYADHKIECNAIKIVTILLIECYHSREIGSCFFFFWL